MSLQAKPQQVEAVMFFRAGAICKEMHLAEFEAVLDGVVSLVDFADQQIPAAYVLITPRLHIRAVAFFLIDFDETGRADTGWNIPLRHLAEQGAPGPDLGGGAIRIACRSRCPVAWHQMHLWDPSLKPGRNELLLLRDAARRNNLGILADEELPAKSETGNRVAPEVAKSMAKRLARTMDLQHRHKTAQLIRQQRLRLQSLTQQYEEQFARLRLEAEQREKALLEQFETQQQVLARQEQLNVDLKVQQQSQADQFQQAREDFVQQLRSAERDGRSETELLRDQFELEMQARIAAVVAEQQQRLAALQAELEAHREREVRQQAEVERLRQNQLRGIERLAGLGVMFVVYHPGTGHLTIPLAEIGRYQDDPEAFVAAKCLVSPEHYRDWLAHYQQPTCSARLPSGERCAMPIDRIDTPSRFVRGESSCCARHQAKVRAARAAG
ncbi:MAG TPA: chromosome partitioning protein ParA [Pseudomonas sp.]|uniref:chromosome partitioning protein ParA n=1 Tax=Pseudomonas sp. TaxID=306 RepID=UPI002D1B67BE|nr:chromosome partitioning protein ParA [Pseudomonas sp.]HTO18549.1 chromosome partitioning protein ParA [Pseudomonas sp.]